MSSYNALYPPNVGAQSAESIITPAMPGFPHIEVHMANKEYIPAGTHLLHLGWERQLWIKCLV